MKNCLDYTRSTQPKINPTERLQEAFDVFSAIIFSDDLPYHVVVPRKTRAYKYGDTHELPVSPVYYVPGTYALAELLHQMWHVWQHRHGHPPKDGHKGHYDNEELREKMHDSGLRKLTDPLVAGLF